MYVKCLAIVFFCFHLCESAPFANDDSYPPENTPKATATPSPDVVDTFDIFVKAALIVAFFAVTLLCCVLKCRCFGAAGDASGTSLWIPVLIDTPETDQTSCNDSNRNRTESRGYPFAPACPPPVLEGYIGALDGNAHPLDSGQLPPPPTYQDALQLPKRPRLNTKSIYDDLT